MPRRATGQVVERERARGTVYGLRFVADGRRQYVTLGSRAEGWTRPKAETELAHVIADVERGIWKPPAPAAAPKVESDPLFHAFASQWFNANRDGWRPKTRTDYEWQLSNHLLPFFRDHRLSQITVAEVDRYRAAKVAQSARMARAVQDWQTQLDAETDRAKHRALGHKRPPRPLSATSINKTITRLGQILEVAVEYGLIARNTARGKRRRLRSSRPAPVWLDSAEQIKALLDAAGEMDRRARANGRIPRRAILATLALAGLRIGELIDLRWRDVNLADGWLYADSKTDAGKRRVDLLPALRDELTALKMEANPHPDARVFPTQAGGAMNPSNVRNRILAPAASLASERLVAAGKTPLPIGLTPHKLRHTFASVLVALGVDPGAVMDQLGHADPAFSMRVYRHGMRRDPASRAALVALVGTVEKAPLGTSRPIAGRRDAERRAGRAPDFARLSGIQATRPA